MDQPQHNEELRNRWISLLLKLGVYSSATLMVLGLVLALAGPSTPVTGDTKLTIDEIVQAIIHPSARQTGMSASLLLIASGLLLLMFTPVIRVVAALVSFLSEKDWTFSLVSLLVLGVLILEITLSLQ